jgi:hypothetical protein
MSVHVHFSFAITEDPYHNVIVSFIPIIFCSFTLYLAKKILQVTQQQTSTNADRGCMQTLAKDDKIPVVVVHIF